MFQYTLDIFSDTASAPASAFGPVSVPFFEPDLASYDHFLIAFSGGKDSVAMVLDLLERGVDPAKIELWHHDVDGREDDGNFMDWPVTADYFRKFAAAFGLRIYFSWRIGGFKRELLKSNAMIAPVAFETPDGVKVAGGERGEIATRRRWPALSPNLRIRWCSGGLKVDVMSIAINNQKRFRGTRVLVMTGERAAESANRAKYLPFENHRCNAPGRRVNRTVHVWRSVHAWSDEEVWAIVRRHGVVAHPCYHLGWGRASCAGCIYGSPSQWASLRVAAPEMFGVISGMEGRLGHTIQRDETVTQRADRGRAYDMDPEIVRIAMSRTYEGPIRVATADWHLPKGAYGENAGPC